MHNLFEDISSSETSTEETTDSSSSEQPTDSGLDEGSTQESQTDNISSETSNSEGVVNADTTNDTAASGESIICVFQTGPRKVFIPGSESFLFRV